MYLLISCPLMNFHSTTSGGLAKAHITNTSVLPFGTYLLFRSGARQYWFWPKLEIIRPDPGSGSSATDFLKFSLRLASVASTDKS